MHFSIVTNLKYVGLNLRGGYAVPEKKLNLLAEKEGIRHEIMQPGDLEQTIACIIDAFPRAEPMTKALRITPDEFYLFAEMYCKKAIKDRLSVIAKDTVSGNVIGFLISGNLASEPPEGIETIHEKFHPIMALLDTLDEEYKKSVTVNEENVLRLFMGGVSKQYEGKNIVTTLIEENLTLAKLKNFSRAIGEATGSVSQHILLDKLGFQNKYVIEYKAFTYNGEHVFRHIEDASRCILVEKQL